MQACWMNIEPAFTIFMVLAVLGEGTSIGQMLAATGCTDLTLTGLPSCSLLMQRTRT